MKTSWMWLLAALLAGGLVAGGAKTALAEEKTEGKEKKKEITIEQLPEAVRAAILKEAGQNKIEEIEKEVEEGKTVYEAEWKVEGKEMGVKVAEDGTLLEKEEQITMEQLPAAVKATILKEAGENKITEVHKVVGGGKTTYEAAWMVGEKEAEVTVGADGAVLAKEEPVTMEQLPAAVKATIQKEAGENKITELEKAVKAGKTTYEAAWMAEGKEVEITVAEDGTVVKKAAEKEGKAEKKPEHPEHPR